jgi:hypothetical protein
MGLGGIFFWERLAVEEGQEGMDAGQPDPRAGQSSGPLVDSLVALNDSDVDVGGAHNLFGDATAMFILAGCLSSTVQLSDAQSLHFSFPLSLDLVINEAAMVSINSGYSNLVVGYYVSG